MYKVFTSLWAKPIPSSSTTTTSTNNKTRYSSDSTIDEDGWVLVSDTVVNSHTVSSNDKNSIMTNSWIASPPLMRTDQSPSINRTSSPNTHHFNPIENLLIEHASMSVYEQIASRTRTKRHRKTVYDAKLDEQGEEIKTDDDDDDRSSVVLPYTSPHPNISSIHQRNLNASLSHSTNSSISPLESSTSSLIAHHRHLQRIHHRRRRSGKTSSKLTLTNQIDESKQTYNKVIERQRLNYSRTPKLILHQPSRANH